MAGDVTLGALARILTAERQNVTAVAAPVGTEVGDWLETVWDAVVDLDLVAVRLGVALRDALGDHLLSTLLVTRVAAVLTLATSSIEQELATERAAKHLVELARDKLVAVDLRHVLLALPECTLTTETGIIGTLAHVLLDKVDLEVDGTGRLDGKPRLYAVSGWTSRYRCSSLGVIGCRGIHDTRAIRARVSRLNAVGSNPAVASSSVERAIGAMTTNLAKLFLPLFLDNVADSDPEHANGDWVGTANLVVYGNLKLVGIVDGDLKVLLPAFGAAWVGAGTRGILDLDDDGRLADAPGATRGGGMVNVAGASDGDLKGSGEGLAEVLAAVLERAGHAFVLLVLHDVKLLVSLEGLLEEDNLGCTLYALGLGIVLALAVTLGLV